MGIKGACGGAKKRGFFAKGGGSLGLSTSLRGCVLGLAASACVKFLWKLCVWVKNSAKYGETGPPLKRILTRSYFFPRMAST